jgi:hypothetical protein
MAAGGFCAPGTQCHHSPQLAGRYTEPTPAACRWVREYVSALRRLRALPIGAWAGRMVSRCTVGRHQPERNSPACRYSICLFTPLWCLYTTHNDTHSIYISCIYLPAGLAQPLWITLKVGDNAIPGNYTAKAKVTDVATGAPIADLTIGLTVWPFSVTAQVHHGPRTAHGPRPRLYSIPVQHTIYIISIVHACTPCISHQHSTPVAAATETRRCCGSGSQLRSFGDAAEFAEGYLDRWYPANASSRTDPAVALLGDAQTAFDKAMCEHRMPPNTWTSWRDADGLRMLADPKRCASKYFAVYNLAPPS